MGCGAEENILMGEKQILAVDELLRVAAQLRAEGKTLVFTNGCFDILHPGHVRYLERARELGDLLVVGVNSDHSVRELKGASRPIFPQAERAEILAALASVNYVIIFDELTPQTLIARLLPHVLVKGGDWGPDEIVGREEVEAAGGKVIRIDPHEDHSTTRILETVVRNFS